jgi:hypothetical protein
MTDSGRGRESRIAAPDLVQMFGVVLAVVLALVTADTFRARAAVMLAVMAAAVLLAVLVQMVSDQRPGSRRYRRIAVQGVAATALVVVAAGIYSSTTGGSHQPSAATPPGRPLIERTGYLLSPSSSPITNDQDKVDLDTGCPGWGDMVPHIGPRRCGELADLIVDGEGLHTRDGGPHLLLPATGRAADYDLCRAGLGAEPDQGVNQIDVGALAATGSFCVETDRGNIAAVRVGKVTADAAERLSTLTIDFTVWRRGG